MADEIKALAHTPVLMHTLVRAVRVKIKYSLINMRSRGIQRFWIMPDKRQLNVGSSFSCLLFFTFFKQVSRYFRCCCNTVCLCSSRSVLWTMKLQLTFMFFLFEALQLSVHVDCIYVVL